MVANHRGGGESLVVVTTLLYCFISTRAGPLQRRCSHGLTNFLCFFTASTLTRETSQFDYRFFIGSKEPIIDYGKNSIFTSLYSCISRQFLAQFRRSSCGGRRICGSCHTARVDSQHDGYLSATLTVCVPHRVCTISRSLGLRVCLGESTSAGF